MVRQGTPKGEEIEFQCANPEHPDVHPSARWNRSKATWRCYVCGVGGGALDLADRLGIEKPARQRREAGGGMTTPPNEPATVQHSPGCTLAVYAEAKRLPVEPLRAFGLSDMLYQGAPAVRIPYHDSDSNESAVRFRVRLVKGEGGADRFKWRSGAKPCLYGLDRLAIARERGYVILQEGESDCHTAWHHVEPAIGLPGAGQWKEARDAAHFDGIPIIYVPVEPDDGGATLITHLAASSIADRVHLVSLGEYKDLSALHIADSDRFAERWAAARESAVSLTDRQREEEQAAGADAWNACADLAQAPDILAVVARVLASSGVAGEARTLMLLFLILVSRFLPRPVSAAVKGPSSGGKSYTVERVLDFFPERAYYALSAMSEHALAYDEEPLVHRYLVIYEAAGMASDMASYLMRSLLSEGKIRYITVEKTTDGMRSRLIERPGPTGLIVTTTAVTLHPENETRLLSIPVTDTREQTRAVFRALARDRRDDALDLAPWHALQTWLAGAEHRVTVPYDLALAELVPPAAVRLRRDFGMVLALIRAHAIFHQATRDRDDQGQILATIGDYAAVRVLIADLIADAVELTVSATMRETVEAVRHLVAPAATLTGQVREGSDSDRTCSIATLASALTLDKSATSRRVAAATKAGYLRNLEDRKGRPAKIALGDPMPDDTPILPEPDTLTDRCSGAGSSEGINTPTPPRDGVDDAAPPEPTMTSMIDHRRSGTSAVSTTAREIMALPPDELATYRAEVAAADPDDQYAEHDRAALSLAELMLREVAS